MANPWEAGYVESKRAAPWEMGFEPMEEGGIDASSSDSSTPMEEGGVDTSEKTVETAEEVVENKVEDKAETDETPDYATKVLSPLITLEGNKTEAYTLDTTEHPKAGVTVAKGFDIGQHSKSDLETMGFSEELIKKFTPFFGKKGTEAETALKANALTLTEDEVKKVNNLVLKSEVKKLKKNFKDAIGRELEDEDENVKQALLMASYQIGNKLFEIDGKATGLVQQLKDKDYTAATTNLKSWFKDNKGLEKRAKAQGEILGGTLTLDKFDTRVAEILEELNKKP